jgi:cyclopropane fatty-acyl-phospholipid synthase-like methyltransferase
MDNTQSTMRLTESYARWRSSRLGQITDALEQQLLSETLGSVTGKTLLDVGCGDGFLSSELARRGAIVTGLDTDSAMMLPHDGAARPRPYGHNSLRDKQKVYRSKMRLSTVSLQ